MIRPLARRIVPVLAASLTTGCLTVGQAGVLGFDYETRDRMFFRDGPGTAIALGGYVDLNVYARAPRPVPPADGPDALFDVRARRSSDEFDRADVIRALSSIPDVAGLDAPAGNHVRVHGLFPGSSTITVESALGNDTIVLEVAKVEAATVSHWFTALVPKGRFAADTAFLQGTTGRFAVSMRDASGRSVVGAGVVPPIAVEPAGAASVSAIADGDLHHAELRFGAAGAVELRTLRSDPFRLTVVSAASVKAIELTVVETHRAEIKASSTLQEGKPSGAAVRGVLDDGRTVLLLGDGVRVESATPEVCGTPQDLTEVVRRVFGDGITAVSPAAAGTCTLVAALGALRAEARLRVEPKDQPPVPKSTVEPDAAAAPVSGRTPVAGAVN